MRRTMNIRGFLVLLGIIGIVFLVLFWLLSGKRDEVSERERAMQIRLTELEERNRVLNEQLSEVGTKNYIATSAIDNYSYMNRNDIRFEFTNPKALYTYSEEEIRILLDEMNE